MLEQSLGCPGKAKSGWSRRGWRELAPSHQLPVKLKNYWEGQPAEMSGPGSYGGGDRVKACYTLRMLGGVTGPAPLSPMNCYHPGISLGVRNGCQQSVTGQFPPVYSLCWAAPPGLQVAGQWARGPSRSPRQTLGNPEEPLNSSQGSRDSRAAGWWLPCQGPAHPDGKQA